MAQRECCGCGIEYRLVTSMEDASQIHFTRSCPTFDVSECLPRTASCITPPHVLDFVTRIAVEMHSGFEDQEVSTETCDITGSLWTSLLFRDDCAFL